MVPVCFPSKISSTTGLREAVVFALPSVTGLVRWTDYIPVKLVASADAALEGRTDAGGFIPMDMLSSNAGLMGWVDYLPVYVDNSATDAWAITATGFIPYAPSGGISLPSFYLNLSNAVNATIADSQGYGTITSLGAASFYLNLSNAVNATISDDQGRGTVTGGGGGAFSGSPAFARTSGTAPLYVNLDMTAIVSSLSSNSNHDCLYVVDWGDSGAGTWENGVQSSGVNNRNVSYGPWAGHVYETGGSKTVSITVYDGTNVYSTTQVITVTSADAAYPTTSTVCISHSGNFTGIPSGASTVTAGSTDLYAAYQANKGANKRLMFCKADAWTCTAPLEITQANVTLDGYGTGSAFSFGSGTAVGVTTSELGNAVFIARTTGTDARIWGFKLTCAANTGAFMADETIDRVLVGRVEKQGGSTGFKGNPGNGGANNVMEGLHYYKCLTDNPYAWGISGRMSVYSGFVRGGMSGCYFDNVNDLEQTCRHSYLDRAHINNNTIKRPNATKNVLKLHSFQYGQVALYSEKIMVSGNVLDLRGGIAYNGSNDVGDCSIVIGDGGLGDERVRNYIVENNLTYGCEGQPKGFTAIAANAPNATVRNNIAYFGLGDGTSSYTATYPYCTLNMVMVATGNASNPAGNARIYNNSLYSNLYNAEVADFVRIFSADVDNVSIKNNLWYLPFHNVANSNRTAVYNTVGATNVTTSNNTSEARTSPNFVASPPVALTDWRPNTGSYAIDAGTAVPVLRDFNYATRTGTYDLGAVIP